jgi:hypothetical protein
MKKQKLSEKAAAEKNLTPCDASDDYDDCDEEEERVELRKGVANTTKEDNNGAQSDDDTDEADNGGAGGPARKKPEIESKRKNAKAAKDNTVYAWSVLQCAANSVGKSPLVLLQDPVENESCKRMVDLAEKYMFDLFQSSGLRKKKKDIFKSIFAAPSKDMMHKYKPFEHIEAECIRIYPIVALVNWPGCKTPLPVILGGVHNEASALSELVVFRMGTMAATPKEMPSCLLKRVEDRYHGFSAVSDEPDRNKHEMDRALISMVLSTVRVLDVNCITQLSPDHMTMLFMIRSLLPAAMTSEARKDAVKYLRDICFTSSSKVRLRTVVVQPKNCAAYKNIRTVVSKLCSEADDTEEVRLNLINEFKKQGKMPCLPAHKQRPPLSRDETCAVFSDFVSMSRKICSLDMSDDMTLPPPVPKCIVSLVDKVNMQTSADVVVAKKAKTVESDTDALKSDKPSKKKVLNVKHGSVETVSKKAPPPHPTGVESEKKERKRKMDELVQHEIDKKKRKKALSCQFISKEADVDSDDEEEDEEEDEDDSDSDDSFIDDDEEEEDEDEEDEDEEEEDEEDEEDEEGIEEEEEEEEEEEQRQRHKQASTKQRKKDAVVPQPKKLVHKISNKCAEAKPSKPMASTPASMSKKQIPSTPAQASQKADAPQQKDNQNADKILDTVKKVMQRCIHVADEMSTTQNGYQSIADILSRPKNICERMCEKISSKDASAELVSLFAERPAICKFVKNMCALIESQTVSTERLCASGASAGSVSDAVKQPASSNYDLKQAKAVIRAQDDIYKLVADAHSELQRAMSASQKAVSRLDSLVAELHAEQTGEEGQPDPE